MQILPRPISLFQKLLLTLACFMLVACGGGDSDSGAMSETAPPETGLPESFIGTYKGTVELTAEALGLSETDTFEVTITVTADNMVRFDGDEPDETFTADIANNGSFSGSLDITEEECTGTISVTGSVDGVTASGDVDGSGNCSDGTISASVTLSGTFTARKQ